jgi:hypothetical protein
MRLNEDAIEYQFARFGNAGRRRDKRADVGVSSDSFLGGEGRRRSMRFETAMANDRQVALPNV